MPKLLRHIRGRLIFIVSFFQESSSDILSHYFGQHSTQPIKEELEELSKDGILSDECRHVLDASLPLYRLTDFGKDHLALLQRNLEFQEPKATKKEHIYVLRARESMFLFDLRIVMVVVLFLTDKKRRATSESGPRFSERDHPIPVPVPVREVEQVFVSMTTASVSTAFAKLAFPSQPKALQLVLDILTRKPCPEIERRRDTSYVRNLLFDLWSRQLIQFRFPSATVAAKCSDGTSGACVQKDGPERYVPQEAYVFLDRP